MRKFALTLITIASSICPWHTLWAQGSLTPRLKVFVEGSVPDFNYVRNNTLFVDFVNDSKSCDVHLIISRQETGGGGRLFTLDYSGITLLQIPSLKLTCITSSDDTQDVIREKLTKTIQSGFIPFMNEKNGLNLVTISSNAESSEQDQAESASPSDDPWRQWVFTIDATGGLDGESQRKNNRLEFSLEAQKITEKWKFKTQYDYERRAGRITKSNGDVIHTLRINKNAEMEAVFSMTPHWSWGTFFRGSESSYDNINMSVEFQPGIQYNIYPWKESDRRRFTFTYKTGHTYNKYYETTILGKDKEGLWKESFEINLNRVEKWGELDAWLETGNYFPGFQTYYFNAGFDVSIRIAKGLSLNFRGESESIHNQIYLPEGEISEEDLLLNIRRLPTSFQYSGSVGFRYRFGSIFNNTVNERF